MKSNFFSKIVYACGIVLATATAVTLFAPLVGISAGYLSYVLAPVVKTSWTMGVAAAVPALILGFEDELFPAKQNSK
jgi:hypothetical protein